MRFSILLLATILSLTFSVSVAQAAMPSCGALAKRISAPTSARTIQKTLKLQKQFERRCLKQDQDAVQVCFALYSPVCGKLPNGKKITFSNSCERKLAGARAC